MGSSPKVYWGDGEIAESDFEKINRFRGQVKKECSKYIATIMVMILEADKDEPAQISLFVRSIHSRRKYGSTLSHPRVKFTEKSLRIFENCIKEQAQVSGLKNFKNSFALRARLFRWFD